MSDVDKDRYVCRECGVKVSPAAIRPENLVRPYFTSPYEDHKKGCNMVREQKLLDRARKGCVTRRAGEFPGTCPNALDLSFDSNRTVTSSSGAVSSRGPLQVRDEPFRPSPRRWVAKILRPIAQSFINFPFDRDTLDLDIPGIAAKNYLYAFRRLKWSNAPMDHSVPRVFHAPLRRRESPLLTDEFMGIHLYAGARDQNGQQSYRVRVEWAEWSARQKATLWADVETGRKEVSTAKEKDRNTEIDAYLFFMGQQDRQNLALFRVWDYRLICCIVDSIEYPKY